MSFVFKRILNPIIYSIFTFIFLSGCNSVETVDSKIKLNFASTTGFYKIAADTLQLDTVKILLRDIKIRNQSTDDTTSIIVGPFVVYLNLAGVTSEFAVGDIPPGNYDRIKFKVHKIEGSEVPPDPEFKEGGDESLRYSVIVKGIFNSTPFIYKSRKPAHQDLKLETPLVVDENGVANLTILVDPFSWFMDVGNILNPSDSINSNKIDNNIKDSFKKAYQDN
jgi:hypothetical protein